MWCRIYRNSKLPMTNKMLFPFLNTKHHPEFMLIRNCLLIFIFFLIACNKDKVSSTQIELAVYNASPYGGSLQVLQNLKPVGGVMNYMQGLFPARSNYVLADSGFNNYKVKKGNDEVLNFLLSNTTNKCSLFLFDTISKFRYVLVNDNLDTPGRSFAKLRVMHFAPDVDTFNLALNNGFVQNGGTNVDWIYYSQEVLAKTGLNGFFNVNAGSYTLLFRRKNPQTNLKSYQILLTGNKIYTFVLKGYKNRNTGDSLSLSIIQH